MFRGYHNFRPNPVAGLIFLVALVALLLLVFVFLPFSIVSSAFGKLGLTPWQGVAVALAALFGSRVDFPVYKSNRLVRTHTEVTMQMGPFGMQMNTRSGPGVEGELVRQIFAVNLGGCIVPLLMCFYLLSRLAQTPGQGIMGITFGAMLAVGAACFAAVRPVPGKGLSVSALIPLLTAALAALFLSPPEHAPAVAYVAGTLGVLLGADIAPLLNPRVFSRLDAETVSVGGAGTFGAVFLTGILSVFLA